MRRGAESQWHVAALLTVAMALAALLFPSPVVADDAPGHLDDTVVRIAEQHAHGKVEWVRYVALSADEAARLLGKNRGALFVDTPDRVYLVVMKDDFSLPGGDRDLRSPYLAFLYWGGGGDWTGTDFTLLREPVALESVGTPQELRPFGLVHPTLQDTLDGALALIMVFGPAVLLAVSAVLCAVKRRSGWPYTLAAVSAVAVAVWQVFVAVGSVRGQSWDPAFHGIKFGVLAVLVAADLLAAITVLRRRPRAAEADAEGAGHRAPRYGIALLAVAAVLSVLMWYPLATTGE